MHWSRRLGLPATTAATLAAMAVIATPAAFAGETSPRAAGPVFAPECPAALRCDVVPAAYDWSSANHSDPNNYGNYDPANRPADGLSIRYIVLHDTESSGGASPYDSAIATFQDPTSFASAHYVIRSSDGHVTQMVQTKDVAWHAGNWTLNEHSIGIEQEGIASQGGAWYTEQMYQSSAALVRYLAARYGIPLDREHILGHEDVSREIDHPERPGYFGAAHWDPGPYWDWNHFMDLLHAPVRPTGSPASPVVTIRPDYASNQPPLQDCSTGTCTALPPHGANFVYLRTAPSDTAPLLTDPALHPDGSPGTTDIGDWSDKAVAGRSYVRAGRQGDWTAIWYGGRQGWFYNPGGTATVPGHGRLVTAKAGATSVPLYGRAFPEQAAYPASIPFDPAWQIQPILWTLPAGQQYVAIGSFTGENYYARFDPAGVPGNHTLVHDATGYTLLSYNHRVVFARTSDLQTLGTAH
jgi:N-acetyl-anhydromuramyl-L-alanine amidase AmpD